MIEKKDGLPYNYTVTALRRVTYLRKLLGLLICPNGVSRCSRSKDANGGVDDYNVNDNLKGTISPKEHIMMGWRVWAQKGPAGKVGVNPGTNGEGPDVSPEQGEADIAKWEAAGYVVVRNHSTVDVNDPETGKRVANYDKILNRR